MENSFNGKSFILSLCEHSAKPFGKKALMSFKLLFSFILKHIYSKIEFAAGVWLLNVILLMIHHASWSNKLTLMINPRPTPKCVIINIDKL